MVCSLIKFRGIYCWAFIIYFLSSLFLPSLSAQGLKQPNVAGTFYPKDKKTLEKQIRLFLYRSDPEKISEKIEVLISPHAGYRFSGQVAAYGFRTIQGRKYDAVVVIAPSHFADFDGISVWSEGLFKTPIGRIKVDKELAQKLIDYDKKISFLESVFSREHSLEVQLPFLQEVLGDFSLVPIIIGRPTWQNCKILTEALLKLAKDRNILVVASTDLSHYHSYNEAIILDRHTIKYIQNLDAEGLIEEYKKRRVELCGLGPVISAILYAQGRNINKIKLLKYANSGDVTGDKSKVVGYASIAMYKQDSKDIDIETVRGGEKMLNQDQKKKLLKIARNSLEEYIRSKRTIKLKETDPALLEHRGAFVTLNKSGNLRGCIGRIVADKPLYEVVNQMAIEAAVGDPRFPTVTESELKDIEIEISALTPLERIKDVSKIKVGTHGIIIRRGYFSGLLLPQVATDYGWDRETFLEHTCLKAGLPKDAWKEGAEIQIFSAEVFSEKEIHP